MFDRIMVPYDGSSPADSAVEYAFELAKSVTQSRKNGDRCQIIIVHVVPNVPATPLLLERPVRTKKGETITLSEYIKQLYEEMVSHAIEMLEKKKKELETKTDGKIAIKVVALVGDSISSKILELADKEKVDLIIIGNVGLSGISKLKTLGSVSRAISERASCPVLIVHASRTKNDRQKNSR
jgi:nucleotide-binding universal stress UspA family protein